MGISSSAMPNNSKSGVGCTASCNAITVKASIKLSKPPIGWAAEHGASIFVSEVRDWCFLGWANWSGDFLVDTKMKPSEVILLALNLFLFSWKCIQFNGSFPSLNLLDWLDLLSTPGFIWIDPILTDSFIHYMILGTILNSWTWIHCMLREFRYLTTMQEDVSVGSLVALNFSQICLDHIAIITRQIAGCRRPSWCRPACTSARLNPRFFTRGSAWYFPQEGTNLRRRHCIAPFTRKNRKKKQRKEQNSRVSVSPGSTLALLC